MRKRLIGLTLLVACVAGSRAFPAQQRFGEYLDATTSDIQSTLEEEDGGAGDNDSWYFRRFTLRVRPYVTFTAGIAKLNVIPDIELLWERPLPDGWEPFKP